MGCLEKGGKLRNLGWLCLFSVSVGGFPCSTHTYLRMMGVGAMPLIQLLAWREKTILRPKKLSIKTPEAFQATPEALE